jgi:hypothetical protein
MNKCLCCNDRLIKHLDRIKMYWFCPSCHQEMPNLDLIKIHFSKKITKLKSALSEI